MDWKKTGAYKAGIIDENGKKLKSPKTSDEKKVYTMLHRLTFNLRRLLEKIPGGIGKWKITRYAAALWLIKEEAGLDDKALLFVLNEAYGVELDVLNESLIDTSKLNFHIDYHAVYETVDGNKVTHLEHVGECFDIPIYRCKDAHNNEQYVSITDIQS